MLGRNLSCFAVVAVMIVSFAGRAALAAGPDLSTPKKAAVAFAKAVEQGDMEGAKAASIGTDEDYALVKVMSDFFRSFGRMQAAAQKAYGAEAKLPVDMSAMLSNQFEQAE